MNTLDADGLMVTGGSEAAVTPLGLAGFIACRALSQRNDDPATASRPSGRKAMLQGCSRS